MKQQEKTKKTKERIISAAIKEFGSKSYDTASINNICETGNISKGLIYHNFKNKDQLYLQCVQICYNEIIANMKTQLSNNSNAKENLQKFLSIRQQFFSKNPCYANIFFNAVLYPPKHLIKELSDIRKDFDKYCSECCLNILNCLTLREGITQDIALEYFSLVCEIFNGYFQKEAALNKDYHTLVEAHEDKLPEILDIMFYGIVEKNKM